jgi:hypothetical protein
MNAAVRYSPSLPPCLEILNHLVYRSNKHVGRLQDLVLALAKLRPAPMRAYTTPRDTTDPAFGPSRRIGSQQTRRWSGMDSNVQFRAR